MVETNAGPNVFRAWYLHQQPTAVLAVTVAGALAGGGLLHIATRLPNALVGLVGVVLATGCAWVTADYTSTRWRDPRQRGWRRLVVACGIVGLVVVIVSNIRSWPFPAFAGLVAVTIGVSPTIGEVREDAKDGAERWMLGGMSASLVGTVVLAIPALPAWTRLAAVVAILAGLGFFTGGLSAHTGQRAALRSRLLRLIPGDAGRRACSSRGSGWSCLSSASRPATSRSCWSGDGLSWLR